MNNEMAALGSFEDALLVGEIKLHKFDLFEQGSISISQRFYFLLVRLASHRAHYFVGAIFKELIAHMRAQVPGDSCNEYSWLAAFHLNYNICILLIIFL